MVSEKLVGLLELLVLLVAASLIVIGLVIVCYTAIFSVLFRVPGEELFGFFTSVMMPLLDEVLVLIIGIDIMRTLAVAIKSRALYVRAALEAALLAVVREVIGAEIRQRTPQDLLYYVAALVGVVLALVVFERYVPK